MLKPKSSCNIASKIRKLMYIEKIQSKRAGNIKISNPPGMINKNIDKGSEARFIQA